MYSIASHFAGLVLLGIDAVSGRLVIISSSNSSFDFDKGASGKYRKLRIMTAAHRRETRIDLQSRRLLPALCLACGLGAAIESMLLFFERPTFPANASILSS